MDSIIRTELLKIPLSHSYIASIHKQKRLTISTLGNRYLKFPEAASLIDSKKDLTSNEMKAKLRGSATRVGDSKNASNKQDPDEKLQIKSLEKILHELQVKSNRTYILFF